MICLETGAVAGITCGNDVSYWYGEIAGYYLCYLGTLTTDSVGHHGFAKRSAQWVARWLQQQWADEYALTRLYRSPTADWRNDFVFAFDLAMVLKGLAAAQPLATDIWRGHKLSALIKAKLQDERGLLRVFFAKTQTEPPTTWSTTVDGYQLKAAAGLIAWGEYFQDHELCHLGRNTARELTQNQVCDWPHLPLHPRLYALEGLLLLKQATPSRLLATLQTILLTLDLATERTDVIAQLVRLGLYAGMQQNQLEPLVWHLLDTMDMDGAVAFRRNQAHEARNTWCAIFVRQALQCYEQASLGRPLAPQLCI